MNMELTDFEINLLRKLRNIPNIVKEPVLVSKEYFVNLFRRCKGRIPSEAEWGTFYNSFTYNTWLIDQSIIDWIIRHDDD